MELKDIIQIFISLVTLGATIYIPEKIKWEQRYSQLLSDYRGYDFAVAVQGVIQFFTKDCKSDVERIKREYKKRFEEEIEYTTEKTVSSDQILHYQRRLLNQFYYELELCAATPLIGKRRVSADFTKNEANIIKIIYFMNKAVEESPELYKDISAFEHVPKSTISKGMNKYILRLYELLKKQGRFMK